MPYFVNTATAGSGLGLMYRPVADFMQRLRFDHASATERLQREVMQEMAATAGTGNDPQQIRGMQILHNFAHPPAVPVRLAFLDPISEAA